MIYIYDESGQEINLKRYDLRCFSFIPESLTPEFETEKIGDRTIILGTNFGPRRLFAKFLIEAVDHIDYQLLRDEIFKIFNPKKTLYIIDRRQPGKRWVARNSTVFRPEYVSPTVGRFDLEFVTEELPFCESVGNSLTPLTFDVNLWQIGQGLHEKFGDITHDSLDGVYKDVGYVIENEQYVIIYNAGDVEIDPRSMPLKIEFTGDSSGLTIYNHTNGTHWSYLGETSGADTIIIDGVTCGKNGMSIFKDTSKELLTLATSVNLVEINTGGAINPNFKISFDFRFYYF